MSRLRVDVTKVRWAGHLLVASLIATLGHLWVAPSAAMKAGYLWVTPSAAMLGPMILCGWHFTRAPSADVMLLKILVTRGVPCSCRQVSRLLPICTHGAVPLW
jgi:hypothetical protein